MLDYEPNVVLSNISYKVVGTRPIRHDGVEKVTGHARYGADVSMPDLLHGKILRSPHAHARIKRIDASKALALPGVKAVATSADFHAVSDRASDVEPGEIRNFGILSANCLARDKVLYKGHAVAAVAATSPHAAEEALAAIEVEYEPLPAVFTAEEALADGAPILHERLATLDSPMGPGGMLDDDDAAPPTNVARRFVHELGDPDAGFGEADVIVERRYRTEAVHQGYIEPHSATVYWDKDKITVWTSTQGHFGIREQVAKVVGVPVSKIKVIPMEIGGGFGGKTIIYVEPVAAVLSRKTGQPVKITMSRTEVFFGTGPTSGTDITMKIGATNAGRITAATADMVYEGGAYPGSPLASGSRCIFAAYDVANLRVDARDVVVNKPKVAAYRAPGAPAAAFAGEQAVDELARALKMDPIELRLANAAREGTRQVTGPKFGSIGCVETLEAAKEHAHYAAPVGGGDSPPKGKRRGRGFAIGFWGNNGGPSACVASVNQDGRVSLIEGSPDIGGSRAAIAMQFAEVLGLRAEDVNPAVVDTDSIGFTSQTGGSSVAYKTGWAAYEAAQDIKRQMIERAALVWGAAPEDVEYEDGGLRHKSDPELKTTFAEIAARQMKTGGPIVGKAATNMLRHGGAYSAHVADVEVDLETGKVDVLRYTVAQDAGKAVHPSYVESQMQGGAVAGIGWALSEEYYFDEAGELRNPTFLDYRMPTSLDVPMIDTVIVEKPHDGHPFAVRGAGEVPLVPPMAAVANAVYDATDVRMASLPMSPAKVLEALWEHERANGKA